MARGIIGLVGLAATLAFAAPLAVLGVEWLVGGRPMGAVLLGFAALMVAVEEYLVGPKDLVFGSVQRVVGGIAKTPDEEE